MPSLIETPLESYLFDSTASINVTDNIHEWLGCLPKDKVIFVTGELHIYNSTIIPLTEALFLHLPFDPDQISHSHAI